MSNSIKNEKNGRNSKKRKRKRKNRRMLFTPDLLLSSEFETGNGIDFTKYDEDIYGFTPIRDPGELYSGQAYYFKFSIKNRLRRAEDIKNVTVTAIADYDEIWKGWSSCLNIKLWKYSNNGQISHLDDRRVKATPKSIGINLSLRPQEKVVISNMLTFTYTELESIINDIHFAYPSFTKVTKIGESAAGNGIYSVKIKPDELHWASTEKEKILVSGTPQSSEIGDFAAVTCLRRFLDAGPEYWDEFHKNYKLEFILFQNPDGIIEGRNMVNSEGENIFFSYKKGNKNTPKENQIVWSYIENDPPDLYLEYHSFFQDKKTIRPYIYPKALIKDAVKKKIFKKVTKKLISFCNGAKQKIKIDQKWFKNTLAYRLQEDFETIAIQFKTHNGMEFDDIKDLVWEIFEKLVDSYSKYAKRYRK